MKTLFYASTKTLPISLSDHTLGVIEATITAGNPKSIRSMNLHEICFRVIIFSIRLSRSGGKDSFLFLFKPLETPKCMSYNCLKAFRSLSQGKLQDTSGTA